MKIAILLVAALTFAAAELAPLVHDEKAEIIPGEYLVIFKESFYAAEYSSYSGLIGSMVDEPSLMYTYDNGFAAVLNDDTLTAIRSRPEVELVEANQRIYFSNARKQFRPRNWGLSRISQREYRQKNVYAYPESAGENVIVYVIDTGIAVNHKDFGGRASNGFTAYPEEGFADNIGHGTHVASTIVGKEFGVAKKAQVVSVKVFSKSGYSSTASVAAGISWVMSQARKGSPVNMSLGGAVSWVLDTAVERAIASGLPFAIAAGNSHEDACFTSPARVDTAVTVGASTNYDALATFSNYGTCVDIIAPGQDITAAWNGWVSSSKSLSGTSMASPHVAGVMALLQSVEDLTPAQLKARIIELSTKDVLGSLRGKETPNRLLFNGAKL